jgi:Fe-S cluster assembly scaffold protein SufB
MGYYKSFNAEALELSKTLPEEQSELYKRYFVPIPLEAFAESILDADENEENVLKEISASLLEKLRIKFDLVVGSAKCLLLDGKDYIKVVGMDALTEEHIKDKMFKSSDDRGVAFIHAYSKNIVLINVPAGKKADLRILFVNTDVPLATQVLIDVGRESVLNIFEWYASKTSRPSLSGVLHEVRAGDYAKTEISLVHNEDAKTQVMAFAKGFAKENASLKMNFVYNGGLSVKARNEISTAGYSAKSDAIEIVMGSAEQKFDINTIIANVGRDTVSDLDSRAVLLDRSVCILKGFANVGENASGSRSFVNERGILLDKRAYMSSIPGMSINNSNVKATHSSATAPIEEDLLFYIMSKGVDETVAKRLIVSGFLSSSIAKMESPLVKEAVASLMHEKVNNKVFGVAPKLDISNIWFDPRASQAQGMFEGHYKYREQ